MQTYKINEADNSLEKLFSFAKLQNAPIHIENNVDSAIVLSAELWRDIEETLFLLSLPDMRETLVEGIATPLSQCSKELDWQCGQLFILSKLKRMR